jgi:hypothetical protein
MLTLRRAALTVIATLTTSIAVGACGGGDRYADDARPAAVITITGFIGDEGVSVSPTRFGAGPIKLIVTNQTDTAQKVTLESDDDPGTTSRPGLRQSTVAIRSRDTASLKADVASGRYAVHVDGDDIRPAHVSVGDPRPSAQNDLLQP